MHDRLLLPFMSIMLSCGTHMHAAWQSGVILLLCTCCSIAWAPAAEHERNHCSILRFSSVLERKAPCGHAQTCLAKYVWFKGFSNVFSLKQALCLLSKRTLALRRLTHLLAHNSACGTTWSRSAAFDKVCRAMVVPLSKLCR